VRVDRMAASAPAGFSLATDVAEHLVKRGVPFRQAHEAVGHLVMWCTVNEKDLQEVSDEDLLGISEHLTPDIRSVLSVPGALAARSQHGGTAPVRVREQLAALSATIEDARTWARPQD